MKNTEVKMNKPIYLRQAILDISKTLINKILTNKTLISKTIINIKTEDFYEGIADNAEEWFDTSNCDKKDKRPSPIGINKKVPGMFKDELGGKIMEEFVALKQRHIHT